MIKEQTMTIQGLADVAGVSKDTISRTAKKLYPSSVKKGVLAKFTANQSLQIMQQVRKKNIVQHTQAAEAHTQNAEVDIKAIIKATAEATAKAVIQAMNSRPTVARLPDSQTEYMTALAWCKKYGLSTSTEYLNKFGRVASKLCREQGIEIKKVEDEKYHTINSYHVDVLSIAWKYL